MFYLKLTEEEAQQMISAGILALFNGQAVTKFKDYTDYKLDTATGDKYFAVEDLQYDNIIYPIESFVILNFPDLTRYTPEFVSQFDNNDTEV